MCPKFRSYPCRLAPGGGVRILITSFWLRLWRLSFSLRESEFGACEEMKSGGDTSDRGATSYQERVEAWLEACFPPSVRSDRSERTHRFLEEALELAQANGCSRRDAIALVEYVFGRPQGQPDLEVGGVMVTLASLCSATGLNMDEAGDRELERNWSRIETIRAKQQSKPHGSPLPQ